MEKKANMLLLTPEKLISWYSNQSVFIFQVQVYLTVRFIHFEISHR